MSSTPVFSPVEGRALALADVPDPVFSGGMVGYGAAVDPPREVIYAVCFYGGWPKGSQSVAAFQEVLAEPTSTWPQSHLIEPPLPLVED